MYNIYRLDIDDNYIFHQINHNILAAMQITILKVYGWFITCG